MNFDFIKQVGVLKWLKRNLYLRILNLFSIEPLITLPNSIVYKIYPWDPFGAEVFITHADVDWGFENLLLKKLKNNINIVDVGAHTGYYSLYLYNKAKHIYAFEPNSKCFNILTAYANKYDKIEVIKTAVSKKVGMLIFLKTIVAGLL
jgi:hypothetical protein